MTAAYEGWWDSAGHWHEDTRPRCARGEACGDPEIVRDDRTGDVLATLACVLLPGHYGLCPGCERAILASIRLLPGDVVELFAMLRPSMAVRYRDPGMPTQPRVKLHSPLPFEVAPLTLAELIVHETGEWAASVAAAAGIPWDRAWYRRTGPVARVDQACILLARNLRWLLGLGPQRHPARSLSTCRTDGHDPDTVTRDGRDYWTTRDGLTGALLLHDLHGQVVKLAGRNPAESVPIPCPACRRRTLVREHRARRVYCRHESCDHHMSDDAYDRMSTGDLDQFRALSARLAADRAGEGER